VQIDHGLANEYRHDCTSTLGGPLPGRGAPPNVRPAIEALVIAVHTGVGVAISGCLGIAQQIDGDVMDIGAAPDASGVLSVAVVSPIYHTCLILGSAAAAVADLILDEDLPVACAGGGLHQYAGHGDAYLIDTEPVPGCYAFIRTETSTSDGQSVTYTELPPGVSDAWVRAQILLHELLLARADASGYQLTNEDGVSVGAITTSSTHVRLTLAGLPTEVVSTRAYYDWSDLPS
jgi:hypothetical protein